MVKDLQDALFLQVWILIKTSFNLFELTADHFKKKHSEKAH